MRMTQTTAYDESGATAYLSQLEPLFAAMTRRRLTSSLLLFAAGHRPFAFLFSQAIYMAEPLCDLIGLPGSRALAHLLSRPDGIDVIESRLLATEALVPDTPQQTNRRHAHVLE
jgi:hypothetical protein